MPGLSRVAPLGDTPRPEATLFSLSTRPSAPADHYLDLDLPFEVPAHIAVLDDSALTVPADTQMQVQKAQPFSLSTVAHLMQ